MNVYTRSSYKLLSSLYNKNSSYVGTSSINLSSQSTLKKKIDMQQLTSSTVSGNVTRLKRF